MKTVGLTNIVFLKLKFKPYLKKEKVFVIAYESVIGGKKRKSYNSFSKNSLFIRLYSARWFK